METRQLKYFLDVANCLNFTRAAQMNHMAQTTMSQNISSLEVQLGFKLFERSNRNVKLSTMGEVFYHEAVRIIMAAEQAERYMEKVKSGAQGVLRIGFQGEHESQFLPPLIKLYHAEYPDVSFEFHEDGPKQLENMLNSGWADIIFNLQDENASEETEEYPVDEQPLYLVVPPEHKLAKYDIVSRGLLAYENMVFFDPSHCHGAYNNMLHESMENGFQPNIVAYGKSIHSILMMVECGIGISILPKSCDNGLHNVKFIELDGDKNQRIVARWKKNNNSPVLQNFLVLMKRELPPHNMLPE